MSRSQPRRARPGDRVRRGGAAVAAALVAWPLLAATPGERGDPASHLPATDVATEYWDWVARFDSGHALFARFMITNEGPGERTGIAYGHLVDPDGTAHYWSNGRREQRWTLGPRGLRLEIGSSVLDLSGPGFTLDVHKRRKGVEIALRAEPVGPALWSPATADPAPPLDVLALGAPIRGTAWFRGMPEPVSLAGRVGITHTWMGRSETDAMLRRSDFFSLGDEPALYLGETETPEGVRSHWIAVARGGEKLFLSDDFQLTGSGRSPAGSDPHYPIPDTLRIEGERVAGVVRIGAGLLHHDPMEFIPQPFRFLLSFKMHPHRVWADTEFKITYRSGGDSVTIQRTGIASVTFLNPIPPTTSIPSPPKTGE